VIEGGLEALRADGEFVGWLRDTALDTPAVLHIRYFGQVVAVAAARGFRPDLLAAGHGHGHYGFMAKLGAALPPGPAAFELYLPLRDQGMQLRLNVPRLAAPSPTPIAALVAGESTWSAPDLARVPGCLRLAAERARMGTPRFVDVTFRFALRRWPQPPESKVYCLALDEERLSPEAFLVELLESRERAGLGPALPSPWDPEFPYQQPGAELPAEARPAKARRKVRA
jgi:hypothetical protein